LLNVYLNRCHCYGWYCGRQLRKCWLKYYHCSTFSILYYSRWAWLAILSNRNVGKHLLLLLIAAWFMVFCKYTHVRSGSNVLQLKLATAVRSVCHQSRKSTGPFCIHAWASPYMVMQLQLQKPFIYVTLFVPDIATV